MGTVFFFLLFQKGAPLSTIPMVLASGAALMALALPRVSIITTSTWYCIVDWWVVAVT